MKQILRVLWILYARELESTFFLKNSSHIFFEDEKNFFFNFHAVSMKKMPLKHLNVPKTVMTFQSRNSCDFATKMIQIFFRDSLAKTIWQEINFPFRKNFSLIFFERKGSQNFSFIFFKEILQH